MPRQPQLSSFRALIVRPFVAGRKARRAGALSATDLVPSIIAERPTLNLSSSNRQIDAADTIGPEFCSNAL